MKRENQAFVVAALFVFAACSQQTARPPARLSGTRTLAVVNDLVFVTSTDRSELRAIRSSAQDFVRAPNPLEPLAIPVLATPDAIERDVRWVDGLETPGQFVYAWRNGGPDISVVGVNADSSLREERRIDVGEPITAVAARAQASEGGESTLYYGFYSVNAAGFRAGLLMRQRVPAATNASLSQPEIIAQFDDASITSISVLPGENQVVVSTRSTVTGSADGNVFWLDTAAPAGRLSLGPVCSSTTDCGFSRRVRELRVAPRVAGVIGVGDGQKVTVFGLLDETACSDGSCAGIEAVELRFATAGAPPTTRRALDDLGLPMKTIVSTGGLFTSIDLSVDGTVQIPGSGERRTFTLLGLASTGNGDIIVFDGDRRAAVDSDSAGPNFAARTRRAAGRTGSLLNGPAPDVALGDGAARSETVEIVFHGTLIGAQSSAELNVSQAGIPVADFFKGDVVSFSQPRCPELTVTEVVATGRLVTTPPPAPECFGLNPDGSARTWQVRAVGEANVTDGVSRGGPYVVRGPSSGYMGRATEGVRFEFPAKNDRAARIARYFQQTEDAKLANAQLAFTLNPRAADIARDDAYLLDISSNFRPLSLRVNTAQSEFQGLFVPGSVVRSPSRGRTYISYPAANVILEMDTGSFDSQRSSHAVTNTYR